MEVEPTKLREIGSTHKCRRNLLFAESRAEECEDSASADDYNTDSSIRSLDDFPLLDSIDEDIGSVVGFVTRRASTASMEDMGDSGEQVEASGQRTDVRRDSIASLASQIFIDTEFGVVVTEPTDTGNELMADEKEEESEVSDSRSLAKTLRRGSRKYSFGLFGDKRVATVSSTTATGKFQKGRTLPKGRTFEEEKVRMDDATLIAVGTMPTLRSAVDEADYSGHRVSVKSLLDSIQKKTNDKIAVLRRLYLESQKQIALATDEDFVAKTKRQRLLQASDQIRIHLSAAKKKVAKARVRIWKIKDGQFKKTRAKESIALEALGFFVDVDSEWSQVKRTLCTTTLPWSLCPPLSCGAVLE